MINLEAIPYEEKMMNTLWNMTPIVAGQWGSPHGPHGQAIFVKLGQTFSSSPFIVFLGKIIFNLTP